MKYLYLVLCATLLTSCAGPATPTTRVATSTEVSFAAADGSLVVADLHTADADDGAPILLLFHQGGGDARGEYGPIIPRLVAGGRHVLAVDLREGGDLFGSTNRTLARRGGRGPGYCAAYPDLEASLAYVRSRGFRGPCVAWGSSFSGALVLRLARDRGQELAGVIAFSPASGEAMDGCRAEEFVPDVGVPALCVRPASEVVRPESRARVEEYRELGFRTWIADPGTHGSSSLVSERAGGDVEATWEITLAFLDDVTRHDA